MNDNGVVKEEPQIASRFIPIGIMMPAEPTPEPMEVAGSRAGSRWFAAIILLIVAWWIIDGWRLFQ